MKPETQEPFVQDMLTRFAAAGDLGIHHQYVPDRILQILQKRGHVTKFEATPRITEAGQRALGRKP